MFGSASRWMAILCVPLACAVLVGCGGSSAGADPSSQTPVAASPSPTPTPVTAAPSPTPSVSVNSVVFTPTSANFPNPDRGFYLPANPSSPAKFADDLRIIRDVYELRLAYYELLLPRSADLDAAALSEVAANLTAARQSGVKIILRAVYCHADTSPCTATLPQILSHATQLKTVLRSHAEVLHLVQAGFIGSWGEWANNTNGVDSQIQRQAVASAVLEMVPNTVPVAFRQVFPIQELWYAGKSLLTPATAFDASAQARSGVHNDCFMTSYNDRHTFPGKMDVEDYVTTKTELEQRQFVASLSEFTPFGGEPCAISDSSQGPMRMSCIASTDGAGQSGGILNEGPRYHLNYLNRAYNTAYHDTWIAEGCYETVARSMGHRIQLDSLVLNGATATVTLRNVGWSRTFNARALVVTLRDKTSGATYSGQACLLRNLASQAGESTTCSVAIGAPAGTYDVLLSAPDPASVLAADARFALRFANAETATQRWDGIRLETGVTATVP